VVVTKSVLSQIVHKVEQVWLTAIMRWVYNIINRNDISVRPFAYIISETNKLFSMELCIEGLHLTLTL